jgi:hypothetical protein
MDVKIEAKLFKKIKEMKKIDPSNYDFMDNSINSMNLIKGYPIIKKFSDDNTRILLIGYQKGQVITIFETPNKNSLQDNNLFLLTDTIIQ